MLALKQIELEKKLYKPHTKTKSTMKACLFQVL